MKRTMLFVLSLVMLFTLPYASVSAASNLTTDQKFEALKNKGIFTGFSDGSSRLYESMTREQFATALSRLLELPTMSGESSYNDVLRIRWSSKDIEAVTKAGLMKGVRSRVFAPADPVTVEQLAAVLVRITGISNRSFTVSGKVSSWARQAVSGAIYNGYIPQLNDYTVNATRGQMVDAFYEIYQNVLVKPIQVKTVEALTSRSIKVTLVQSASEGEIRAAQISLRDVFNNNVPVGISSISKDGLTITLWTNQQISGIYHILTVDDHAWNFMSISEDQTKPTVQSIVRITNKQVEVTFSEPVEANSAKTTSNYQINNGLRVDSAQLSSDQRKVTLTTGDQVDGRSYQMTVRNVKDLAGNVMDSRSDLYFTGSNDSSKPKVTSVNINPTATITVKFSEKIDTREAAQAYHYSINNGLSVTEAKVESDGSTVTLKTSAQRDATLYTITISGIPDLAGNMMDQSTNWMFGGISNPEVPVTVQNAQAINVNTIEITFNRPITDTDVNNLVADIILDNGANVSMADWKAYVVRKNNQTVTVQYRTKQSNPELFVSGHVYFVRVKGVVGLTTADNKDRFAFAGTITQNRDPYVTQIVAIGNDRIKVLFSEPVTNVEAAAFILSDDSGNRVQIDYDELGDRNKIVTEVILRLKDKLTARSVYQMKFVRNYITDAPKWNVLTTTEGNQDTAFTFTASW
ncbi:MAG: Ig-like domain-containing protein [Candidatus Cohnella colombiensis]|uniref:Ig-like domain-containing protein n=1 Tax=Candidatus Cohnella colombiensis TaxID=3121368 RepID=A0AA95EX12_9BACL|nr:MAG: Ig-like domain-containing protein [Cohnella sp.]